MSNIKISFKNLEVDVLNNEGVNILAYMIINELMEEMKTDEITNTSPDEEPPKMDEIYYMVSENGIDTEQWSDHKLDEMNWKSGRATKDIDRATAIFKSLYLPS